MLDGGGEEEHRAAHRGIRPAVAKLRGADLALEIGNTARSTPAGGALFHRQGGDGAVHARDQERREEHGRILIQSVGTGANWSVHVL